MSSSAQLFLNNFSLYLSPSATLFFSISLSSIHSLSSTSDSFKDTLYLFYHLYQSVKATLFVCGQRPKDLVITWVVLFLDTTLIYFWVHFWFKSGRRPRTSPGLVKIGHWWAFTIRSCALLYFWNTDQPQQFLSITKLFHQKWNISSGCKLELSKSNASSLTIRPSPLRPRTENLVHRELFKCVGIRQFFLI